MKTNHELMLEFMTAMSPAIADYVFNNPQIQARYAATECALLARELVMAYLENT